MRIFYTLGLTLLCTLPAMAQRGILLEKYTSAWCGVCPDAHLTVEALKATYPSLIPVMHHSSADNMGNPFSTAWRENFNISGTPQGVIDRKGNHAFDLAVLPSAWEGRIQQRLAEPPVVELTIKGSYEPAARALEIDVEAVFSTVPQAQELRLNVMILEDSVTGGGPGWFQSNYFDDDPGHPLEGMGNPILQYPHRYVLRDILDSDWGTGGVIPASPDTGVPYTHSYTYTLPEAYDAEQVQIVAFIARHHPTNPLEREVLNAHVINLDDLDLLSADTEIRPEHGWRFYPNPAPDFLYVEQKSSGPYTAGTIELFNSAGKLLQRSVPAGPQTRLDLHGYPPGFYVTRVHTDTGTFSYRFIIQR